MPEAWASCSPQERVSPSRAAQRSPRAPSRRRASSSKSSSVKGFVSHTWSNAARKGPPNTPDSFPGESSPSRNKYFPAPERLETTPGTSAVPMSTSIPFCSA